MEDDKKTYFPLPTLQRFHNSGAQIRCIVRPVGQDSGCGLGGLLFSPPIYLGSARDPKEQMGHRSEYQMKGKTAQHILKRYTIPERIGTLSKEALGEEMRKRSMGKFGIKDAESLIGLARETVGIKEGLAGIFMDIRHILMQLEAEGRFIPEIEAEMEATLERIPCSVKLLSIKGLGTVSVAGLIGEVGDFSKFSTQSEIMKLAGLDLYEISSGKRKGQRRISKRGRSLLRKILFYAAIQMIRKNGIMYDFMQD
jgi:transposase